MYINAADAHQCAYWLQMMIVCLYHAHLSKMLKNQQSGGRFNELMQILSRIAMLFKEMQSRMRAIYKTSDNACGEIMSECLYIKDVCKDASRKDEDEFCTCCLLGQIKDNTDLLITAIGNLTASIEESLIK